VRVRARAGVVIVASLALVGGLTPSPMAVAGVLRSGTADRKHQIDRQLDDLRESLEGTSKKLVDAAVDLKRAQEEQKDAQADLVAAQAEAAEAQRKDDELAAKLTIAQAAVDKATRELQARQAEERATVARLGAIAREAYVGARLSGLSIALDAQSPAQFADRVNAAGTALRQQNGTLARLAVQQTETRARKTKLAAAEDAVAELKKQSAALLVVKRAAESRAEAANKRIADLVAKQRRAVATISARKKSEKRRIASLEVQQKKLTRLLRSRAARYTGGGGGGGSSNAGSGLSYPVNAPITSGFGMRYHPILHYSRLHAGTDFGAACGTPVRAAASGRIVRAGWVGGFGNQVLIAHGQMKGKQLASSYNHLSRIVVRSGSVSRGQLIAYSGTTGLSTGCHLHFEVYVNGTHVNPMNWL
jgi:murein DD-endopeptidase MepM/ murein hydrolase activator NlpD